MSRIFLLIFFSFFSFFCYSQNTETDSLFQIINNTKNDTLKIQAYLKSGEILFKSNPDSSLYYISFAQRLSAELIDSSDNTIKEKGIFLHAKSLYKSAFFMSALMEYNKAEKVFQQSLKELTILISKTKNKHLKNSAKHLKANNYSGIADIYLDRGSYSEALNHYIKSQEIIDELIKNNFLPEQATAGLFFHIGMVHFELGNLKKSLFYYEKSLAVSEKFKDDLGVAKCNNNIGIIKLKTGKAEEALIHF